MLTDPKTDEALKSQFLLFSAKQEEISFTQTYKWFKQAEIFDEQITGALTEKTFNTYKAKKLDYETFMEMLDSLFTNRGNLSYEDYLNKLTSCGKPGPVITTNIVRVKEIKKS